MSDVLTGRCLCSSVRFGAAEKPQKTLACHCVFCQRLTGSAFYVESLFRIDAVRFEGGQIETYEHVSDTSGKKVFAHFCARCGTVLGLTFERWPGIRAVSRSCFDLPDDIAIDAHIWTRSAQAGIALPSGVDCFSQSPYLPNGQAEAAKRYNQPVMASDTSDAYPAPGPTATRRRRPCRPQPPNARSAQPRRRSNERSSRPTRPPPGAIAAIMRSLEARIPPPIVAAVVAIAMWGVSRAAPLVDMSSAIRLGAAAALLLVGIGFSAAGIMAFRRARTTVDPTRPQQASSLVRSGVYRLTRNPMYVGLSCVLAAWAVFLGSAWALLGPVAFMLYIGRFQIAAEERALQELFGDEYADYRAKVRRWL